MLRLNALAAPVVAAVLWTPFMAGCGGAPSTPSALCVEQVKVSCAFQFQCCTDAEDRNRFLGGTLAAFSLFASGAATTEAECVENGTAVCQAFGGLSDASVERGRVEFDAEAATRCVDNQRDALSTCDVKLLREKSDDCSETLTALGKEGDPCISGDECDQDAACEFDTGSDGLPRKVDAEFALPEGECVDLATEGDNCDERECREDLFCNDLSECERRGAEGDACTFNSSCKDGLFCNDVDVCEREVEVEEDEDFGFCGG